MNPSATIHDLPPEMVCEILKHLSPKELIKKKRVCRKWNQLISRMKIERLNVDVSYKLFNDSGEVWYETHRPQVERDMCRPKLLIALYKSPMLAGLKHLRVNNPCNNPCFELDDFDFNELNTLQQLVQLDLRWIEQHLTLNLPNLEIFSVMRGNEDPYNLRLNCPKLRVLRYYESASANRLHVEHPGTIRTLDTAMTGTKLTRFANVELLRTESSLDKSILKLKKLKILQLDATLAYEEHEYVPEEFHVLKNGLENFMKAKQNAGRSDLEVYFAGVRVMANNLRDIESNLGIRIGINRIQPEVLYMKHYDRLQTEVARVWRVDYNRLLALKNPLPADYFDRFWNLREVSVTGPVDEQHVLGFLEKVRLLQRLELQGPLLSQSFFDRLPDVCSPTSLNLEKYSEEKNAIQLNFGFIGKLAKLSHAGIDRDMSLESVQTFIPALRFLTHFMSSELSFKFRGIKLSVSWENDFAWVDEPVPENGLKYTLSSFKFNLKLEDVGLDEMLRYLENPSNFENLGPSRLYQNLSSLRMGH